VFIALMASLLALPFAFVLGFVAARNVTGATGPGRLLHGATRALMNLTRSVEPLLWAVIFSLWVMVGPFAGMLALWVHSVASLAKLYSEAIEGVDPGPVEAIRSTGAGTLAVLRWGMLPQVVPALLSFTVYRWDINVRMATILGVVGGGGIGERLVDYMQLSAWSKVGTIVVFVTAVVWLMDLLSARARRHVG
jgi:phosphonate transport system permease protein